MTRRSISPEFKREAAGLVAQQHYAIKHTCRVILPERLKHCAKVRELFDKSRGAAGSRSLVSQFANEGLTSGRYQVHSAEERVGPGRGRAGKEGYRSL